MIFYYIMKYNSKDILKLLDELKLYKDLKGIIKDYLYHKCSECNEHTRFIHLNYKYDNNFICDDCRKNDKYNRCCNCEYLYKHDDTNFCICCDNYCKYYCRLCYENDDILRFFIVSNVSNNNN